MRKRTVLILVITGLFITAAVPAIPLGLEAAARASVEGFLNQNAKEFFQGPVRVGKVALDRGFRLRLEWIRGTLKTRQAPVPLEVKSLASQNSVFLLFTPRPVRFTFDGLKVTGSSGPGMKGNFSVSAGKAWRFDFFGDLNGTDFKDLRWLDPQNLAGATGNLKGSVHFAQSAGRPPLFAMNLEAPEPGGDLQARFFDLFLPYLPPSAEKAQVARMTSDDRRLIKYRTAAFQATMPQSDQMKIFLRILVLDYNLKLTLNATLRTDSKDAFFRIARLMGLIEVKTK